MRVLVTGCGGFLGRHIVRQLCERGDEVIGISRSEYPQLARLGMIHRQGDLTDANFCSASIHGVDSVIHTAAVAGVWGSWQHYYQTNTAATEHVIAACRKHSIRTLVFTSSPSVTFDGHHQRGVDETVPYPKRWLCHYPHTKALAEQAVLEAHQIGKLHTLALRPHLIWGDDDPHLIPRVLDRARRGRLRIVGDGTNLVDTVHVTNAAAAHLDGLDSLHRDPESVGGRAYFVAQDEPVNCWQWIATLCEIGGVEPPQQRIGFSAAYRIGAVLEAVYRMTGRRSEPPMTRFVAAQLAKDHYFDISAAKVRLGYRVRVSMDAGLESLRQSLHR